MDIDDKQELTPEDLRKIAGGKKAPLVRITCPRCGAQWVTHMVHYAEKCGNLGCGYEFWLADCKGCVEVLETYDD